MLHMDIRYDSYAKDAVMPTHGDPHDDAYHGRDGVHRTAYGARFLDAGEDVVITHFQTWREPASSRTNTIGACRLSRSMSSTCMG